MYVFNVDGLNKDFVSDVLLFPPLLLLVRWGVMLVGVTLTVEWGCIVVSDGLSLVISANLIVDVNWSLLSIECILWY